MTIYAVFDRDSTGVPAVVPDRFSWLAALLPPVFAIAHGLWLELGGYIIAILALGVAARTIGGAAAFWIYIVFAVWLGFEASALRRSALRRAGWRYRRDVVAAADDLAELAGLRARP